MREIKFRVWDKKYHIFDDCGSPDMFISFDGGVYEKEERTWGMTTYIEYGKADHYELSQYTGLKDKNDKEIFEGDILKIPEFYETPENTSTTYINCVVTFENHSFCVGNQPMHEDYEYLSEECEVIGNVYENPEIETCD